jgi:hypothetical protein
VREESKKENVNESCDMAMLRLTGGIARNRGQHGAARERDGGTPGRSYGWFFSR